MYIYKKMNKQTNKTTTTNAGKYIPRVSYSRLFGNTREISKCLQTLHGFFITVFLDVNIFNQLLPDLNACCFKVDTRK